MTADTTPVTTTDGSAGASPVPGSALPQLKLAYRGDAMDLFLIALKNVFLTLVTLGIYTPWARTNRRRYMWRQVEIDQQRLDYTGTGKELFIGYLKVVGGYLVFFAFPKLVGRLSTGLGAILQIVGGIAIVIIVPYALYWSRRYLLGRTRWRGIRFGLVGDAGAFARMWIWGAFLTVVTLGLYGSIMANRVHGALINNSRYGDARFSYDGRDRDAFRIAVRGLLLSVVTLGIYFFWYRARLLRFRLSHTRFDRAVGTIDVTGGLLFKLTLINLLGNALTLGLAFPWTVTYTLRTLLERIRFVGAIDFALIAQQPVSGDAAGDSLAGALGVELGI
jgi:uncharacterized membrane protein YjgN (DUF898 family)